MKDAEVAAVLEDEFLARGVKLLKGARAKSVDARRRRRARSTATTVARSRRRTCCSRSARSRTARTSGSTRPASTSTTRGYVPVNHNCLSNVPHIYAAGDVSGKLPLSSVAAMQGRKIAEHLMGLHNRAAPPPRLREGRRRRSSPSPRSPTSGWPRPRRSRRAARSA